MILFSLLKGVIMGGFPFGCSKEGMCSRVCRDFLIINEIVFGCGNRFVFAWFFQVFS
jgi:hypothetical protein